jgi:BirA family biotin operon repressor/biotin-[acetyl-CoA-carboxylase] ligase
MRNINLGYTLIQLQSVDSTNSYALRLLSREDVHEGTVILAVYQTQGKGQGGNNWESDEGKNLLFSIILKPEFLRADKQFYLSMCISNGILDFINPIARPVSIKWPNDIYLRGRKVAGILIENTIMANCLYISVVGIGLNVNQRVFSNHLPNPTSLSLETGKEFILSDSLNILLKSLDQWINKLYQGIFAEIKTTYLNNLWLMNKWTTFTDISGRFEGRITDVSESGELVILKKDGKMKSYLHKEITLTE